MAENRSIGIVTVTFNSAAVIDEFMTCLLKQTYVNFYLYVIDNASSDDTIKQIFKYSDPRVIMVRNVSNIGVAEGNNVGIRMALARECDSILLINNDTVFDEHLLSRLSDGLEQHHCDMAVPKILYFDEREKIWCAGGRFSPMHWSAKHCGYRETDDGQFDQTRLVEYSPTCCMLLKRRTFERIGLMDPHYFVYYDDTDFCHRASLAGLRLCYLPSIHLAHKVSSLTGKDSDFAIRYNVRNHVYYLLKHFPWWQIVFLPAFQISILAKAIYSTKGRQVFWTKQRAFWEGISLFYIGRSRNLSKYCSNSNESLSAGPFEVD